MARLLTGLMIGFWLGVGTLYFETRWIQAHVSKYPDAQHQCSADGLHWYPAESNGSCYAADAP
jgi:hypothetical protein